MQSSTVCHSYTLLAAGALGEGKGSSGGTRPGLLSPILQKRYTTSQVHTNFSQGRNRKIPAGVERCDFPFPSLNYANPLDTQSDTFTQNVRTEQALST